jgi:hypothetical protein
MKYCSSVVIGGIDAYFYHMGDELKATKKARFRKILWFINKNTYVI